MSKLESTEIGGICCGFRLIKKEYVDAKKAELYTMQHEKTGAQLLYFDRADENKTFAICFKTLPEDNTGVFHILEHSVLNGSEKFPVKEPFVSMLQSSMQTFLNAMTFGDKTLFPVSSRNEQDLFNLMTVYLDGVFRPLIYSKPEIFMQEGWHYAYEENEETPAYYNGVVLNEMKGEFADVDQLMSAETCRLLYPDTCYGYVSGGHPDNITDLTYDKFIETHKRFYHPSNARIFLDGHMDVERFLSYMDAEYLSKYEYRANDFAFATQIPKPAERTVYYEAQPGEETLAHMTISKILCGHADVEKMYAARVLADYLTGSNEAPLKRAFLERGLAQDAEIEIMDDMYQPMLALVIRNTTKHQFEACRDVLNQTVQKLLAEGLDSDALRASLARMAFINREISEPYGVELVERALNGWLYGDDPLTHIENAKIYDALQDKVASGYFEGLLREIFGNSEGLSYLQVLPSLTRGQEAEEKEADKLQRVIDNWSDAEKKEQYSRFCRMQAWQQSMDSEEALEALPHLALTDVQKEIKEVKTTATQIDGAKVLKIEAATNGIVYMNLYFDVSDFSVEELRQASVFASIFGELHTGHTSAGKLQTRIKAVLGDLAARVVVTAKPGERETCKPYLVISTSMLEEQSGAAATLLQELLTETLYDENDRIQEMLLQSDYMLKQALIANGHQFAITKALAGCSKEDAVRECLEGESFVKWFSAFTEAYLAQSAAVTESFERLSKKAFAKNRMFVGYSGNLREDFVKTLTEALPVCAVGAPTGYPDFDGREFHIEIPASVGFSAKGYNLYEAGGDFHGAWAVLSSLVSFGYLWNQVRVQGGAYGTGMAVQMNGDMFCYSYRDPDVESTKAVYAGVADYVSELVQEDMPLDDMIIGTLNTIDPLLDPAGICDQACARYLKGITQAHIEQIRAEILATTKEGLAALVNVLQIYAEKGIFCAVSGKEQSDSSKSL